MTSSLLKEGTKHLKGVNDAILKNLEAVQDLSVVTRTSMGPNGNFYSPRSHLSNGQE
jgi:T-complex protein 1 subunit theta